ncbi:MAG: hypothetical protein IM558_12440, partial [Chitinophagaceae bacterium]|nr:hypothetical protein [Chitinophagaceae bacterium]
MSTVTCSGIPFLISPTDQVNGIVPQSTQYTWDPPTYSNVSLTGGNSGTSIGQVIGTLINGTNVLQSATYVITPKTTNNCIGTPFTAVVYVESKSKITEMSTTVCSGIQFRVTPVNETNGIVPLGTKYTWVLPVMGNASLTGGESISVPQEDIFGTLYNATNKVQTAVYIITPGSESCGSSNQFTLTVYVNSTPQISAMSTVVCSGVTFVVSPVNQTNGIVPDGTNYSWNIPSVSSPSLTGGQSGSGLYVTGTLLNFTNTPKSATYQVEPIAPAGSCKGGLFTVTVIVNPGAYITEMSTTVCSGVQFDISPRNGVNGIVPDLTTYNWDVPTLSASLTGGASNSNQPSIFGKLTNSSNVTRTAVYTVVPNVQSCETYSSFTLTVYVNPTPKISEMSTVVCSGLQFEVSPTNGGTEIVPVTTRYAWEIPAVSTTSLVGGQSDSGRMSVTGILTNNTNTTRTAVYTVTPTSILGECKGATFTVLVTVNPKAVITAMSTTVCSGLTFDISPSNQLNGIVPLGTKYRWNLPLMSNVSLTGGETNSNQNSIFGTLTNATNVVRTAAYTVIPNSPLCGDNNPFTLTVFVNPKAVISAMSVVVCSGVQFSVSPRDIINGIVPADTKYSWDVPTLTPFLSGGQAASLSPTITGTLNSITNVSQTAIYIVRPRSPDCGTNSSFTLTVIVNPIVVINTMTVVTCSGVPFVITPTNVTNGIIPDDTFYGWSVPTFTGTVTGGQSASNQTNISGLLTNQTNTTNTVTYTVYPSTPSCISNAPFTVIVTLHPIADIRAMSVITCSGVPFRITPTDGQNGIVPIGTKYRWSAPTVPAAIEGGAAASDQSDINGLLRNTSNAQLTATYYVIPTSVNCSDDFGFTVTVTINPTAEITVITRAICSDVPFVISPVNNTNGIVPDGTLYTWNVPVISMSITGGASGTQQNFISGKLRNTSSVVQTATYSVEPLSGNCIGKN